MLVAVSYDITDNARRSRVSTLLKNFGDRVQRSVFECLLEPPQIERLAAGVAKLIEPEEDSVRVYEL